MDEVEAVARAIEDQLTAEDGWMVGTPALSSMCRDFAQAAIAALDAARGDSHNDVLSSCQPYLKQGETPAECIKRNRDDGIALMELLAAERIKVSNYEKTMAAISEIENGEARRRRLETASEAQLIDYINELEGKLCAALDAAREKEELVARALTDPQRMLWKDDVEGICLSVDLCFEYGDTTRCWPCAAKQSASLGIAVDTSQPALPEVARLRRELKAQGDRVAQVVEWLRKENGLCDCHARCETECGCGAWDDWKTKPLLEIADAIERGEPFNG